MAIEGPLQEMALSDVLQLLDLSRKTGVLTVRSRSRGRRAEVRLDRGAVVGATLPGHSGRLGQLLLLAGKVTQGQVDGALEAQRRRPGRLLGEVLVAAGAVSVDEVMRQLRFQVEETVFELVRWTEGDFRFEEGPAADTGPVTIHVPTEALLMESARRIDEWTTLSDRVPDRNVVPRLVEPEGDATAVLNLHPREWEVLAAIDGGHSLQVIARELGRAEFDVAKTVFSLASSGIVEVGRRREPALNPVPDPLAIPGLAEVERALVERRFEAADHLLADLERRFPGRPEVAVAQGRVRAGHGEWRAALDAFTRALDEDPLMAPAYFHLAAVAARAGDLARAEDAWRTFSRLAGDGSPRAEAARRGAAAASELLRVLAEVEP